METEAKRKTLAYFPVGERLIFDELEIDAVNRILLRDGIEVPLTGRVFDLLLILAQNPGRLLEKDDLIDQVWHDEFVEQGNLTRNISTLRKALGDTGRNHKYILTVQGRGYRFTGDVRPIKAPLRALASNGYGNRANGSVQRTGWREYLYGRFWLGLIALLVLTGAGMLLLQMAFSAGRAGGEVALERMRQIRLTQDGDIAGSAISRDGEYLAYIDASGRDTGICIRQVRTGSVLRLVPARAGENFWAVAIAPDNSYVYYILQGPGDNAYVFRVPLLGGQPRRLPEAERAAGGLAVSPDGTRVAFTRVDRAEGTASIVHVAADGSDAKTAASVELESNYYSLDWSPDGQRLIYCLKKDAPQGIEWSVEEVPAEGGQESILAGPMATKTVGARWLPDQSGLILNAVDESTRKPQIYHMTHPGRVIRRITNDLDRYRGLSLTGDGRALVAERSGVDSHLWLLSIGGGVPPVRLTGGAGIQLDRPSWLGNELILYDEDPQGGSEAHNVWRVRPDGSRPEQITFGQGNNTQASASPDGKTIVFVSERGGKRDLWLMAPDGNDVRQLTHLPHDVFDPRFSRDGEAVYFLAFVAGKKQIWCSRLAGSEPELLIDADVQTWAEANEGNRIAYSVQDKETGKIVVRIHSLGNELPDERLDISPETTMLWAPGDRAIYFNTAADEARDLWSVGFDGTPAKAVTSLDGQQIDRCNISPDTKRVACIRSTDTFDTVMIRFD